MRTLGVAGGGQLARMLVPAAQRLGLKVCVLDPDPACSAAPLADEFVVGAWDSLHDLRALAERSDLVTFEIERVDAGALRRLQALGHAVAPSAEALETVQDKLLQKHFLRLHGIPTGAFAAYCAASARSLAKPSIWKARRGGYDGRGVVRLTDARNCAGLPAVPALIEDELDIERELAVMVARDVSGALEFHPLVEIVMDPRAHVLDMVLAPAAVPAELAARCRAIAAEIAMVLDYVGILAVEFFVTRAHGLLVNEISPRPHNSAHYSLDACNVSQFEQHVRAVAGLGLAAVDLRAAAVSFNVLGSPGANGTPRYLGFAAAAALDGVHVHCYDKPTVAPGRKMAHVTVIAGNVEVALDRATRIKTQLAVVASDA